MDKLTKAGLVCMVAHEAVGQRRKYTDEPYYEHPFAVVDILEDWGIKDEDVLSAALLHDVIEDTRITYEFLLQLFGKRIAGLVLEVTDVSKPEDGNRTVRKRIDKKHLAQASAEGQTIKLADLIHNTRSIVKHDPGFARLYLREKEELLQVLTKGDPGLLEAAWAVLRESREKLNENRKAGSTSG